MVGKTSAIENNITGVLKKGVGDGWALAAIEESWSIITGVFKEDVVVIGSSLALTAIEESATEESLNNIAGVLKEGAGDCLALAGTEESATEESAIEESWSVITGVLKEDVVVIGSSLALAAIEESWSNIIDVLKEGAVIVGSSLALEESWTDVLKEGVVVVRNSLVLAAIEESWSIITGVLKEGVIVVRDSMALAVTKGRETDDIRRAVEMKT